MVKKFRFLIMVVILGFLIGCGGKEENKENTKKIVYSMAVEPESLDPTTNIYARGSLVMQNLFRGLFKVNSKNETVPALAENLEISEDGKVYVIKLKNNIKWSDNSPLTAEDFAYSWKRVLNPEVDSRVAYEMYAIKNGEKYNKGEISVEEVGIEVIDSATLKITLENPIPYFKELLATPTYFPVKKDVVEGKEPWTKNAKTYVSNGPFMVKEFRPKEKYIFVKNPNYLFADDVKLEELEIVFIDSPETEMGAYMNGEIDVAENLSNDAKKRYENSSEMNKSERIGMMYYDFNTAKEPFNNPLVRRAFSLAIDRKMIIEKILQSTNPAAYGIVPLGIKHGVQQDKNYREVVGDQFVENMEEARRLLAQAGYPEGKNLPKIKFITTTSQTNKDIAQAMQNMWKKELGVDVEIVTFESKVYWGEMHAGNFDIGSDGWGGSYPDPMTMMDIFETQNNVKNNRWSNLEYDHLLKENRMTNDQTLRMGNFEKAEKIIMDEMPVMPLYFYQAQYLVNPRIKGIYKNINGHTIFEEAYIETK
ncbi:MAG: peptide ABC transporter substrate-binding protein [Fusobacteriaceae bacterium]